MTEELKPCPFCGGTDLTHEQNGVYCNNLDCGGNIDFGHFCGGTPKEEQHCLDSVAESWNARAEAKALQEDLDKANIENEELRFKVKKLCESDYLGRALKAESALDVANQLLQKVVDDTEIGCVPLSHLNRIEAYLSNPPTDKEQG